MNDITLNDTADDSDAKGLRTILAFHKRKFLGTPDSPATYTLRRHVVFVVLLLSTVTA